MNQKNHCDHQFTNRATTNSDHWLPPQLFYLSAALVLLTGRWETGHWSSTFWGLALALLGIWMAVAAKKQFAVAETAIKPFDTPSVLITDGLFRFSRNPMYVGMVLALLGFWLIAGGYLPAISIAGFIAVIQRRFIYQEERAMQQAFGETYDTYKAKVRRWI